MPNLLPSTALVRPVADARKIVACLVGSFNERCASGLTPFGLRELFVDTVVLPRVNGNCLERRTQARRCVGVQDCFTTARVVDAHFCVHSAPDFE